MQQKSMDLTSGSTTTLIKKTILFLMPRSLFSTLDLIVIEGYQVELAPTAVRYVIFDYFGTYLFILLIQKVSCTLLLFYILVIQ